MKNNKAVLATAIITVMLVIILICMYKLLPVAFQIVGGLLAVVGLIHGAVDLSIWFTEEKKENSIDQGSIPVIFGDEVPEGVSDTIDEIVHEVKYGSN